MNVNWFHFVYTFSTPRKSCSGDIEIGFSESPGTPLTRAGLTEARTQIRKRSRLPASVDIVILNVIALESEVQP